MRDYEKWVRECYSPIIDKYKYQFMKKDSDEFFLIGNGFALYIFIDRCDRRTDVWFVSIDKNGSVKTHNLMEVMKERFDDYDSSCYGNPESPDEQVLGYMRFDVSGLSRHCQDILSGDPLWVNKIIPEGNYNRHVAHFLAPFFRKQGFTVNTAEEN